MGDMHTSACLHCHHTPLGLQEYSEYCNTSDVFKGVVWGQTHGHVYSGGGGGGGGERKSIVPPPPPSFGIHHPEESAGVSTIFGWSQ